MVLSHTANAPLMVTTLATSKPLKVGADGGRKATLLMIGVRKMPDREKLWKLVKEAIHSWESDVNMSDHITDHLISNGVTVRERGRWVRAGGDLHYSGVLYCCSVCSKRHFVNGRHALVTLSYHDELFRTPNFCPNCGADMR